MKFGKDKVLVAKLAAAFEGMRGEKGLSQSSVIVGPEGKNVILFENTMVRTFARTKVDVLDVRDAVLMTDDLLALIKMSDRTGQDVEFIRTEDGNYVRAKVGDESDDRKSCMSCACRSDSFYNPGWDEEDVKSADTWQDMTTEDALALTGVIPAVSDGERFVINERHVLSGHKSQIVYGFAHGLTSIGATFSAPTSLSRLRPVMVGATEVKLAVTDRKMYMNVNGDAGAFEVLVGSRIDTGSLSRMGEWFAGMVDECERPHFVVDANALSSEATMFGRATILTLRLGSDGLTIVSEADKDRRITKIFVEGKVNDAGREARIDKTAFFNAAKALEAAGDGGETSVTWTDGGAIVLGNGPYWVVCNLAVPEA